MSIWAAGVVGVTIGAAGAGCSNSKKPTLMCERPDFSPANGDEFVNITEASGVADIWDPLSASPAGDNVTRVAQFADLTGDGFDDIILHNFFNAASLGNKHFVLKNLGDGTFEDISQTTGLFDLRAQVFAYGDLDNDGDQDVFVATPYQEDGAQHRVFLNDGNAVFAEVAAPGIPTTTPCCLTAGVVLADFNGDAKLDAFLVNGYSSDAVYDQLLFGNGDGTFADAGGNLAGNRRKPSNGATTCDWDDDGDLDIFVVNYGVSFENGHNMLWRNDGDGNFTNVADEVGFAALATGNYYLASTGNGLDAQPSGTAVGSNGFGIICQDVNNDGLLDLYVGAVSHPDADFERKWSDPTVLLINEGPTSGFHLTNEFLARKLQFNEGDLDVSAADFDNDGRLDLAVQRDRKYESRYPAGQPELHGWFGLMHQLPDGTFENASFSSGLNDVAGDAQLTKGAGEHAWADIDHDGDVDLLVGLTFYSGLPTHGRPAALFRNDHGHRNNSIALKLVGDGIAVDRDAIGARVTLTWSGAEAFTTSRQVQSWRGQWGGSDSRWLTFGIGDRSCNYVATIAWPDGTQTVLESNVLGAGRFVEVTYPDVVVQK